VIRFCNPISDLGAAQQIRCLGAGGGFSPFLLRLNQPYKKLATQPGKVFDLGDVPGHSAILHYCLMGSDDLRCHQWRSVSEIDTRLMLKSGAKQKEAWPGVRALRCHKTYFSICQYIIRMLIFYELLNQKNWVCFTQDSCNLNRLGESGDIPKRTRTILFSGGKELYKHIISRNRNKCDIQYYLELAIQHVI
jgi:hypothetical protein